MKTKHYPERELKSVESLWDMEPGTVVFDTHNLAPLGSAMHEVMGNATTRDVPCEYVLPLIQTALAEREAKEAPFSGSINRDRPRYTNKHLVILGIHKDTIVFGCVYNTQGSLSVLKRNPSN